MTERDVVERLARRAPCHDLMRRDVLTARAGSGEAQVRFDAPEDFSNGSSLQGGFLAAMLDSAMGAALSTVLEEGEYPPSIELKVNFIRPGHAGIILGSGRVVHRGRSVAFVEGELRDPDGELIATASTTMRVLQNRNGEDTS